MGVDIVQLKDELRSAYNRYVEEHPNVSINGIGRRMQKSASTVKNLLNSHNSVLPNADTILSFMAVVTGKQKIGDIICSTGQYPTIKKFLELSYHLFKDDVSSKNNYSINRYEIEDNESFLVIWYSGTQNGATKEELVKKFGEFILPTINKLLDAEVLEEKGGKLKTIDENIFLDTTIMQKYLPSLLKIWNPCDHSKRGILYAVSEDVSEEFLKESLTKLENTYRDIQEASMLGANRGSKKMVAAVYGTILSIILLICINVNLYASDGIGGGGSSGGGGGNTNKRILKIK
ncbi:MAG: hypothetical protein HQK52_12845 [Oligoflexia bacterium]|nr:hypothetical protein [Oligoflexia bacterium]